MNKHIKNALLLFFLSLATTNIWAIKITNNSPCVIRAGLIWTDGNNNLLSLIKTLLSIVSDEVLINIGNTVSVHREGWVGLKIKIASHPKCKILANEKFIPINNDAQHFIFEKEGLILNYRESSGFFENLKIEIRSKL